jgi:hypothetical protein
MPPAALTERLQGLISRGRAKPTLALLGFIGTSSPRACPSRSAIVGGYGRCRRVLGSVQNLSHFRFRLSGARPWLTR